MQQQDDHRLAALQRAANYQSGPAIPGCRSGSSPSTRPNLKRTLFPTGRTAQVPHDSQGAPTMSEAPGWDELTRFQQRALIKLFGGGSLRNDDPAIAKELRTRGFVDENNALAMPRLLVLTLAMRRQQAEARSRIAS